VAEAPLLVLISSVSQDIILHCGFSSIRAVFSPIALLERNLILLRERLMNSGATEEDALLTVSDAARRLGVSERSDRSEVDIDHQLGGELEVFGSKELR